MLFALIIEILNPINLIYFKMFNLFFKLLINFTIIFADDYTNDFKNQLKLSVRIPFFTSEWRDAAWGSFLVNITKGQN